MLNSKFMSLIWSDHSKSTQILLLEFTSFRSKSSPSWELPPDVLKLPAELKKAVPARQNEFLRGRACAAYALHELGSKNLSVLRNHDRSPLWPEGFVGSISHTDSVTVSLVAHQENFQSVGIDVEKIFPISVAHELKSRITNLSEVRTIKKRSSLCLEKICTVIFSIKESAFKVLYPLDQRFRDFSDFFLKEFSQNSPYPDPKMDEKLTEGHFVVEANGFQNPLHGNWFFRQSHVWTLLSIPQHSKKLS